MENFYIIVNEEKDGHKAVRQVIEEYLESRGGVCRASSGEFHKGRRYTAISDIPDGTECVITLGGDGTLIRAARDLAGSGLPIIGMNLGGLGYLTQISREGDIRELLDALLLNRYQVEERMMLKGCAYHQGEMVTEDIALNDIVMTREGDLRILKFKIYVDGQFLYEYSADGMLVATPTGYTAYNLSAGGPIAQPDGKLLILTPICPHTLTSSTIVLGPESRIRIEISAENQGKQNAVFDGDTRVLLEPGDYIEVERAQTVTRVIKLDSRSFLDILKHKMYNA